MGARDAGAGADRASGAGASGGAVNSASVRFRLALIAPKSSASARPSRTMSSGESRPAFEFERTLAPRQVERVDAQRVRGRQRARAGLAGQAAEVEHVGRGQAGDLVGQHRHLEPLVLYRAEGEDDPGRCRRRRPAAPRSFVRGRSRGRQSRSARRRPPLRRRCRSSARTVGCRDPARSAAGSGRGRPRR